MSNIDGIFVKVHIFRNIKDKDKYLHSIIKGLPDKMLSDCKSDLIIEHSVLGDPILISKNLNHFNISISHSHNLLAVAVADIRFPLGIDIEVDKKISDKNMFFINEREKEVLSNCGAEFLVLWCAKESLSKLLRTGIFHVKYAIFEIGDCRVLSDDLFMIEYVSFKKICTMVKKKGNMIIALSFCKEEEYIKKISKVLGAIKIEASDL